MSQNSLAAFEQNIREWISAVYPAEMRDRLENSCEHRLSRDDHIWWQKQLFEKGWVAPHWPKKFGGQDWSAEQLQLFRTVMAEENVPDFAGAGIELLGPVLLHYGTPEQLDRHLHDLMAANVWWCQGYSEPNAGSDLASLKMQARRDGDHYVLNGSKIWTTAAHKADKIFCLVRTDNSGRKQEGISFLLVDMRLPGVEVRPIITLDGAQPPDHEVNQVFFDNVRVPISERLGEDGQGWECAKYLLSFERGNPVAPALKRKLGILRRAAEATGRCSDPVYRRKLTELRLCVEAVDALELALLKERIPEIDAAFVPSLLKCRGTEYDQEIEWLYSQTFGRNCIANLNLVQWEERYEGLAGSFAMRRYLNGRKKSIYGGTNEIQRGIIAKGRFGLRS